MRRLVDFYNEVKGYSTINMDKFMSDYTKGKMLLDEKDYMSISGSPQSSTLYFCSVIRYIDAKVSKVEVERQTTGSPLMRVFLDNKSFLLLRGVDSGTKTLGTWVTMGVLRESGFSENQVSKCLANKEVKLYRRMSRSIRT